MSRRSQVISVNKHPPLKPGLNKNKTNQCDGQLLQYINMDLLKRILFDSSHLIIPLVSCSCSVVLVLLGLLLIIFIALCFVNF